MNEPVLVSAEGGRDRRALKFLVGGLVVLLLVGVVGPRLLFGGGDDTDELALPTAAPAGPAVAPPAASDAAVETVGSFSARDPFAALYVDAADTTDPAAAAEPAPPAGDVPAAVEPAPVTVIDLPTFPVPTTAPAVPAPTPRVVHTFALREVYTDGAGLPAARIAVDGQEHQVAVGQDFAGSYRTLSLDRSNLCGVFLYGDRRFSLCQGEETQT
jgi:hypothetical protein